MRRRDALRWLSGAAALGAAGCIGSLPGGAAETPDDGPANGDGRPPCDDHVYRGPATAADDAYPWDLQIRNIALEVYPVAIEISDRSGATPTPVVSCAATTAAHETLAFGLPTDAEYRVRATLLRPYDPAVDATTVSGAQLARPNAALEVTVDRGIGFAIREVHVDGAAAASPTG